MRTHTGMLMCTCIPGLSISASPTYISDGVGNYDNNANCVWTLVGAAETVVCRYMLSFKVACRYIPWWTVACHLCATYCCMLMCTVAYFDLCCTVSCAAHCACSTDWHTTVYTGLGQSINITFITLSLEANYDFVKVPVHLQVHYRGGLGSGST